MPAKPFCGVYFWEMEDVCGHKARHSMGLVHKASAVAGPVLCHLVHVSEEPFRLV